MVNYRVPESQVTSRGKRKVKSGCRTCKLRRVKCDEARPVCCRCLSSGRVCEGYGIWGGGGNQYGRRPIGLDSAGSLKGFCAPTFTGTVSNDESRCLEWFTHRTAMKLPGVFKFGFWDTLVFQAVSKEPAVLHAVLALSSAHKREGLCIDTSATEYVPDEQQQFTLRHYSKAIGHLQPHFSAHDNSSVRVALVTCLIFVFMEYLRGHYQTSSTHLQNGLRLLNEFHARSSAIDCYSLFHEPCCDSVDAWIIQAFIRLDVQAKFLGQGSQYLDFMLEDSASKSLTPGFMFQSINQARQHLDRLFNQIFHLTHECHGQLCPDDLSYPSALLAKQRGIQQGLTSWYQAYTISKAHLKGKGPIGVISYVILRIYYTMAVIMADNCLWPGDESRYDIHTGNFALLMKQLEYIRSLSSSPSLNGIIHYPDMSSSVADLGALPAIYYVAVKCRVRRIRYDAIRSLNTLAHKEGIWNAPITACVARDIVRMEEADFYPEYDLSQEKVPRNDADKKNDTIEPTLPESYRLRDAQVELPRDYAGTVTLKCRRRRGSSDWQAITRQYRYDEKTRTWIEKERT
ncbi:hypothetical protein F4818DRAFT_305583 [Hypoxylon cercidicola]|nr:hypothetical protein F4818DRAFT_305583 [Hypoxylon cercidicola]